MNVVQKLVNKKTAEPKQIFKSALIAARRTCVAARGLAGQNAQSARAAGVGKKFSQHETPELPRPRPLALATFFLTWAAIDADAKLVPSWFAGSRDSDAAVIEDIACRFANRVQLTSDGRKACLETVEGAFGAAID